MSDIKYVITVDSQGAIKSMKEFEHAIDGSGNASEKAAPKHKGLVKEIALGQLAYDAFRKAIHLTTGVVGDSIKAAADQEKADTNLRAALELTGRTVEGNYKHYLDFAGAQQKVTKYADDEIQAAQTLLLNLTALDQKGIDRATKGAMGLATVLKVDLETAARQIGMAINNDAESIGRLKLKIDESLSPQQKQGEVLRQLEALYGRSSAEVNTYSGRMDMLKKMVDEVKESFGNALVKNEKFNEFLGNLKDKVVALIESGKIEEWADKAAKAIEAAAGAFGWLFKMVDKLASTPDPGKGWFSDTATEIKIKIIAARFNELNNSLTVLKPTWTDFLAVAQNMSEPWDVFKAKLMALDGTLAANLSLMKDTTGAISEVPPPSEKAARSITKIGEAYKTTAYAALMAKRSMENVPGILEDVAVGGGEADAAFAAMLAEIVALNAPAREMVSVFDAMGLSVDEMVAAVKQPITTKPWADWSTETQQIIQNVFSGINTLLSGMNSVNQQTLNNTLTNLERWKKSALDAIDAVWGSEKQHQEMLAALEAEYNAQRTAMQAMWASNDLEANRQKVLAERAYQAKKRAIEEDASLEEQERKEKLIALEDEYRKKQMNMEDQAYLNEINRRTELAILAEEEAKKKAEIQAKEKIALELKEAAERDYAARKLSAQRDAAKKQKALDVAQALSGTAQAVIAALQTKPFFPLGLAMAAIAAAMGAAQIAAIRAQPIPLAGGAIFKHPTEFMTASGGHYVAGEAGMEIMATERMLRRIVREEMGGGSGARGGMGSGRPIAISIPVNIGGRRVHEAIYEITQTGIDLERINVRTRNIQRNN